jgi:hypothetical protein
MPVQIAAVLLGVVVGGVITFTIQRSESRRVGCIDRTHRLYEAWQSIDNFPFRVRANDILKENAHSTTPESAMQLRRRLISSGSLNDWIAITRILHFFEECGAFLDAKAIDRELFKELFDVYVKYWVDSCLRPLYEASEGVDEAIELNWYRRVSSLRSEVG